MYVHLVCIQVPSEVFQEDQPLPDDDPIPDNNPDDQREVESVTINANMVVLVGEKKWALLEEKLPWFWKVKEEEEEEKEEEKKEEPDKRGEKISLSSDEEGETDSEGSSDEDSDVDEDSNVDEDSDVDGDSNGDEDAEVGEMEEEVNLGPFIGLALGSALLGGSLGHCHAR